MDLTSFLKGLALGLAGKPMELAEKKEPVAYLYNGVRLPKLPEWDKTAYPYVHIRKLLSFYYLYYSPVELWVNDSGNLVPKDGSTAVGLFRTYNSTNNAFGNPQETTFDQQGNGWKNVIWTGTDIYNADGTLAIAASEPVPVYE